MKIGFVGLGKMGSQMVARLCRAGHQVVVNDHHQENIDAAVSSGAIASANREEMVSSLAEPKIVWLMISAKAVDEELDALLKLLSPGSIIVDGGNSDFRQTRERAKRCEAVGVKLVDVGTSGGILGLENGFSMMVGGDQEAFTVIELLIQALAQADGYKYFGQSGAGHYVKMIHNAIEYGMMESYAEGYRLLKEGSDYASLDLAAVAKVWQHGSIISSGLNASTEKILSANPNLDGIGGYIAESGEAGWTLEVAKDQNVEMPAVQSAVDARAASQTGNVNFGTKLQAAMRNSFGGHNLNKES